MKAFALLRCIPTEQNISDQKVEKVIQYFWDVVVTEKICLSSICTTYNFYHGDIKVCRLIVDGHVCLNSTSFLRKNNTFKRVDFSQGRRRVQTAMTIYNYTTAFLYPPTKYNLENERFRVFEKHSYHSIGVTFRQYVENYPPIRDNYDLHNPREFRPSSRFEGNVIYVIVFG